MRVKALFRYKLLIIGTVLIFVLPLFAFTVIYKLFGYNSVTVGMALGVNLLVGLALVTVGGYGVNQLGASPSYLAEGVLLIASSYVVFLGAMLTFTALGIVLGPLLRESYSVWALAEGWLLTGFGEELLFRGFLLALLMRLFPTRSRWWAVGGSAVVFGLWHLPGLMFGGREGAELLLRLALPTASGMIFGVTYLLSGNLWLAAFVHGSTNYPLSPLITDNPIAGLLFAGIAVTGAFIAGRWRRSTQNVGWNLRLRKWIVRQKVFFLALVVLLPLGAMSLVARRLISGSPMGSAPPVLIDFRIPDPAASVLAARSRIPHGALAGRSRVDLAFLELRDQPQRLRSLTAMGQGAKSRRSTARGACRRKDRSWELRSDSYLPSGLRWYHGSNPGGPRDGSGGIARAWDWPGEWAWWLRPLLAGKVRCGETARGP